MVSRRRCSRRSIAVLNAVCCFCLALMFEETRGFLAPLSRGIRHLPLRPSAGSVRSLAAKAPPFETPTLVLRGQVGLPGKESSVQGTDGHDPSDHGHGEEEEDDFNINVGRALDYLAYDVPLMFSAPPRLEIFTPGIILKVFTRLARRGGLVAAWGVRGQT